MKKFSHPAEAETILKNELLLIPDRKDINPTLTINLYYEKL